MSEDLFQLPPGLSGRYRVLIVRIISDDESKVVNANRDVVELARKYAVAAVRGRGWRRGIYRRRTRRSIFIQAPLSRPIKIYFETIALYGSSKTLRLIKSVLPAIAQAHQVTIRTYSVREAFEGGYVRISLTATEYKPLSEAVNEIIKTAEGLGLHRFGPKFYPIVLDEPRLATLIIYGSNEILREFINRLGLIRGKYANLVNIQTSIVFLPHRPALQEYDEEELEE